MEPYGRTVPERGSHVCRKLQDPQGKLITEVLPWVPDYAPQDVKDSVNISQVKG